MVYYRVCVEVFVMWLMLVVLFLIAELVVFDNCNHG